MEGYPTFLNTKEDYFNMLELDRAETVRRLERLLQESFSWQYMHDLKEGDEGITDDFHRVESWFVTDNIGEDGQIPESAEVVRAQFHYAHDDHSELNRLGFTVEEVEKLIAENRDEQ